MERWRLKPVRIFSTDLDGTVVGNDEATARFRDFWLSLPEEQRPLLVFNSGRLLDDQFELMNAVPLPPPDYVIGGVGTMVSCRHEPDISDDYTASLGDGFDLETIKAVMSEVPDIQIQPERYQHGLKSSWYLHDAKDDALATLQRRLLEHDVQARIVYSSDRDLDILPSAADKGAALTWLCKRLGIGLDEVVVAGDTGNDRAMFELPHVRGIVVANALPELRTLSVDRPSIFAAAAPEADGVVEGLKRWLSASITTDV